MFAHDEAFVVEGSDEFMGYGEDQDEDGDISYVAEEGLVDILSTITNSSFLHGRAVHTELNAMIASMYSNISTSRKAVLFAVKIDT